MNNVSAKILDAEVSLLRMRHGLQVLLFKALDQRANIPIAYNISTTESPTSARKTSAYRFS